MKDFQKFAYSNFGLNSQHWNYENQRIENMVTGGVTASMTPMIIEEREMRGHVISIFDRLMKDRIIWLAGGVDDLMSSRVQAQLMYLDSISDEDIKIYVDSPGGSVKSGLSMVDMFDFVKSDIATTNMGMAASMGSVLLGAGKKGKRSSLKSSRIMTHQSSGGFQGNIQDAEVDMVEWKKLNNYLFELLGSYCGKSAEQVKEDSTRDFWLSAQEGVDYGLIDKVI